MLPAVEPGIDGPLAGPNQRQSDAKHCQGNGQNPVSRSRRGDPGLGASRSNSREGRPQTSDEKETGQRSDHLRHRKRRTGRRGDTEQQSSADQQPLNQKPGARPAARER